jgi:hypothetical protein
MGDRGNTRDNSASATQRLVACGPMRPQKLSVAGPRLLPVLAPQPLPMPMAQWCEEMETLARVKEQIALLAERDRSALPPAIESAYPKKDPNQ